jgi:excisionase family DNA binding protein
MSDEQSQVVDIDPSTSSPKLSLLEKNSSQAPQFLSTAEAARMLGLSTTLVQNLVDQGDLKGWKTRGGHRRIALDSIQNYHTASRHVLVAHHKLIAQPKVSVVIESTAVFEALGEECSKWNLAIDVRFFDSVTEALLELASEKPDMILVEMVMPRTQQIKTIQALENFNQRDHTPLSVVLITEEKDLVSEMPSNASSSIQIVSGPLTAVWLHAYLTGVLATRRI